MVLVFPGILPTSHWKSMQDLITEMKRQGVVRASSPSSHGGDKEHEKNVPAWETHQDRVLVRLHICDSRPGSVFVQKAGPGVLAGGHHGEPDTLARMYDDIVKELVGEFGHVKIETAEDWCARTFFENKLGDGFIERTKQNMMNMWNHSRREEGGCGWSGADGRVLGVGWSGAVVPHVHHVLFRPVEPARERTKQNMMNMWNHSGNFCNFFIQHKSGF